MIPADTTPTRERTTIERWLHHVEVATRATFSACFFWPPVAALKIVLIIAGLVIVPVGLLFNCLPDMYQVGKNRPRTFWELALRNPVGGFNFIWERPEHVCQLGKIIEAPYTTKRIQFQAQAANQFSSLRCLWKYNEERYGEFWFGWKLDSPKHEGMDFSLQFRPWAKVGF